MTLENIKGRGKLVPTRATGVEYQVDYELRFTTVGSPPATRTRCSKCSVRSAHAHTIPDGHYFLQAEAGQIHQLKLVDGKWHYLATR
jgi:hypothetical protein